MLHADTVHPMVEERYALCWSGKATMPYYLITQSAQEVMKPENAPARTMLEYLERTEQSRLVESVSIYSQRGETAHQLRLFYMNDAALAIWKEMGHTPAVLETTKRPGRKAELCFGVPFRE